MRDYEKALDSIYSSVEQPDPNNSQHPNMPRQVPRAIRPALKQHGCSSKDSSKLASPTFRKPPQMYGDTPSKATDQNPNSRAAGNQYHLQSQPDANRGQRLQYQNEVLSPTTSLKPKPIAYAH